jgi:DNA-3-methyladenine glycosylase I
VKTRCEWSTLSQIEQDYHDVEWGVPEHDDQRLFAKLILDGAQAGLSWRTILQKRAGYYRAFDDFDATQMARYTEAKKAKLMLDAGIVRNRLKIDAAVLNAQAYLALLEEKGSFDSYLWSFVGGQPIVNRWTQRSQVPVSTKESDAMSKNLKKRGFKFVGSTICYAFMQAVGMVNDHTTDCFRHLEV